MVGPYPPEVAGHSTVDSSACGGLDIQKAPAAWPVLQHTLSLSPDRRYDGA